MAWRKKLMIQGCNANQVGIPCPVLRTSSGVLLFAGKRGRALFAPCASTAHRHFGLAGFSAIVVKRTRYLSQSSSNRSRQSILTIYFSSFVSSLLDNHVDELGMGASRKSPA